MSYNKITWYVTNFNSSIYFVFTFADEYVSNTACKQNNGRINHIYTKNMVPIKFVKHHTNRKNMSRMNNVYTYNIVLRIASLSRISAVTVVVIQKSRAKVVATVVCIIVKDKCCYCCRDPKKHGKGCCCCGLHHCQG